MIIIDTEHKVMSSIDKQLEKLDYISAKVEVVLNNKVITCQYTKDKPIKGFTDDT